MSLAMFTAVSVRDDLKSAGLGQRIEDAAFGKLLKLEAKHRVFEDTGLSERLTEYGERRDYLVDRHLPELQSFDYTAFLHLGREVLKALGHVYRQHAYALLRKQGLPTNGVFE